MKSITLRIALLHIAFHVSFLLLRFSFKALFRDQVEPSATPADRGARALLFPTNPNTPQTSRRVL